MQATSRATRPTHEQQVLRLARKRTLPRTRDLTEQGLPTVTLTSFNPQTAWPIRYRQPRSTLCPHRRSSTKGASSPQEGKRRNIAAMQ
jgi:hypothetical protein